MRINPLLIMVLYCSMTSPTFGDLNQYMVRTTEWLVEHSSLVCVAEFEDAKSDVVRQVLYTFKGDSKALKAPLKKPAFDGYHYFAPQANGLVRVLFIGDDQTLWQSVGLTKSLLDTPTLYDVFYGVNQFGNIHLTESALLTAIRAQINAEPTKPVRRYEGSTHSKRSGINAPAEFPFECSDETFVLVVDFTERRRDYYLQHLKEGNFAERLHALHELSQLDDPLAKAAIEAATKASNIDPYFSFAFDNRPASEQRQELIRSIARRAMEKINRSQH